MPVFDLALRFQNIHSSVTSPQLWAETFENRGKMKTFLFFWLSVIIFNSSMCKYGENRVVMFGSSVCDAIAFVNVLRMSMQNRELEWLFLSLSMGILTKVVWLFALQ